LSNRVTAVVILTYFSVALIILLSAYFFPVKFDVSTILSISMLILIYIWHRNYLKKQKLSKEIVKRDKGTMLFWIFVLFILALSVRIPFVLLFGMPYEKAPLIYLVILTIIVIEKTDVSAFGFKTQNIGKSLFHGILFYAVFGGLVLLILYILIYTFTGQPPVTSYNIVPFLLTVPFQTLLVGVSEEGFFRGYTQTHLEKFYSSNKAIFVQAILFGIWHFVWNLSPFDPWSMAQYVATTCFVGLLFGYFYSKARNLAPLVLAHGLWNSFPQGIITNEAAFNALQAIPMMNQILTGFLPYAVSGMLTFLFIKYLVKEI